MKAQFKIGTIFEFKKIDFSNAEGFWDCSARYKEMLRSKNKFIINDCWIDEETGQPRFEFRELKPPLRRVHVIWEIGGALAFFGVIVEMPEDC